MTEQLAENVKQIIRLIDQVEALTQIVERLAARVAALEAEKKS